MTDNPTADRLRAWAKGGLPHMAAVDFILAVYPDLHDSHPMVGHDGDARFLNVFRDEWQENLAGLSSGERATWHLVRSILAGDLNHAFWTMDATRQRALLTALDTNQ